MNFEFSESNARYFLHRCNSIVSNLNAKSKKSADLGQYEEIRQSIEFLASRVLENVRVHFFGSRIMGLASGDSDLDIFVEIGDAFESSYTIGDEQKVNFKRLTTALCTGPDWTINKLLTKTSVPVIISTYQPLKLNCDISISNGLSTCNSYLIAHLFNIQPEAISFYHFIRQWIKSQRFEGLKGYTITLLVIFYLQSMNLMPPVEVVQRGLSSKLIAGYEVQFDLNRNLDDYGTCEMYDYKTHVNGFFEFYVEFNFNQVISTFEARSLDQITYKKRYRSFIIKGILIAGPLNKGRNCGIMDDCTKQNFVKLCKISNNFFSSITN